MNPRREVWITGVGIISCLGEGLEAHWARLDRRRSAPAYDDQKLSPLHRASAGAGEFRRADPQKGRPAADGSRGSGSASMPRGSRSTNAGVAGKADILDRMDMIVAAGGGERDIAVDSAILSGIANGAEARRVPQRAADERPAPDAVPRAAPEFARRQHLDRARRRRLVPHLHGRGGGGRRRAAPQLERVAAGQSEISSSAAPITARAGICLLLSPSSAAEPLEGRIRAGVGPRRAWRARAGLHGGVLVLESTEHAEARGAKPLARLVAIQSDRNRRKPGEIEATLAREWAAIEPKVKAHRGRRHFGRLGRSSRRPRRRKVSARKNRPSGARHRYLYRPWHSSTQFLANLAIGVRNACARAAVSRRRRLRRHGRSRRSITQVAVTSVGHWRGEGIGADREGRLNGRTADMANATKDKADGRSSP